MTARSERSSRISGGRRSWREVWADDRGGELDVATSIALVLTIAAPLVWWLLAGVPWEARVAVVVPVVGLALVWWRLAAAGDAAWAVGIVPAAAKWSTMAAIVVAAGVVALRWAT